jgi:glycosyltransferase involved in cell wall biosynthesis
MKKRLRIALVHDYIKEYGGAERVLKVLSEMYPSAPIYTAFVVKNSTAHKEFRGKVFRESCLAWLLKHFNLYSPLRFLAPLVWWSMDLRRYDVVITSCSSFFARGFRMRNDAKLFAYCHTPPRYLYGYKTSLGLQKYWIVRVYAYIVNHLLRVFDYWSAMRVDKWIVNSENVKQRVWKYYRKKSDVVYPPIDTKKISQTTGSVNKEDHFLIVSRLVGAKGLIEAAESLSAMNKKLRVVGESVGYSQVKGQLTKHKNVELMGRLSDNKLWAEYAKASGFIALATDEDFGMTVVESIASGTPVLAYRGGGYLESVTEGVSGVFVDSLDGKSIDKGLRKLKKHKWNK